MSWRSCRISWCCKPVAFQQIASSRPSSDGDDAASEDLDATMRTLQAYAAKVGLGQLIP